MFSNATLFAQLLDAVPDALVGVDRAGVIQFVNRQTERMFGYDRDALVGQLVEVLVPESFRAVHPAHRASYGASPVTRPMGSGLEFTGLRRDGTEFPVDISLSSIQTEDGLLVTAAVREVTEQRRAFEAGQQMAAIVENSDDAIISGTLDGIITSWNPGAERMYGYSSAETIGKSGWFLIPEERVAEMTAVMASLKAGQQVGRLETERVRKDHTVVPVSVAIAAVRDKAGAVVGASAIHHDMTSQRRALVAAQRLAAIVENSDDAIIGRTLEGVVTSWNPAAARMFGYSAEEIVGKSVALLIPEDRADEAKTVVARISTGQLVKRLETSRVRKDGTVFPASITLSPIRDAEGVVVGASVICRDTTEQTQAAQALAETSWRYRLLAENASDLVVLSSPDRIITWVSPSVTRTLGWTREDLLGTRLVDLIHPDDVAAAAAAREVVYAGHEPRTPEGGFLMRIRTKSGQHRWMSGAATPVTDESGVDLGVVWGLRDVEDLVQAREAAQVMAAIVEHSDDAIISGRLDGIITSWNPAAERMYGYASGEIVGKSARSLTPEDRTTELAAVLAKIEAGQHVHHLATKRVRKDGTVFPVSLTVSPIRGADGAIVGTSVIHRDMTELEHAALYARSLIEAGLDPLATISAQGKIMDVNEAMVRVAGVAREALIGTDFSRYFTDPDRARAGFEQAFEQELLSNYPLTIAHRDGTLTDVLCNASVYRDVNGTVLGVLAVARDASMLRAQQLLSGQLQEALNSRVVIEQAKGIVAQRHGVTIDQAYQLIRAHARGNNASLRAVAEAIVEVGLQV